MVMLGFWAGFGRERTRSWQEFLSRTFVDAAGQTPLYDGPLDGIGRPALTDATQRFQQLAGTPVTGIVDPATTREALRTPQWTRAWISPRTDEPDLLHLRPYFVVPLDDTAFPGEVEFVAEQIRRRFEETNEAGTLDADGNEVSGRITDVYVMSHGWHRNFFAGVAAYDRLVSRLATLISRGSIVPTEPFIPLFIGLHWHSDPGENGWLDEAGRRSKASFMRLIGEAFTWVGAVDTQNKPLDEADFTLDFEAVFEFMSKVSAPDVKTLDPDLVNRNRYLARRLVCYQTRGRHGQAPNDDKVSTAWRCYVEAEVMRPLAGQSQKPRAVGTLLDSVQSLIQFVAGTLGVGVLIKFLVGLARGADKVNESSPKGLLATLREQPWLAPLQNLAVVDGEKAAAVGQTAVVVIAAAATVMGAIVFARWRQGKPDAPVRGLPVVQMLAYAVLQLAAAVPLLYFVLLTFLFRTWFALLGPLLIVAGWLPVGAYLLAFCALWSVLAAATNLPLIGVYAERPGGWECSPAWVRDQLAALARWPINWLQAAVGRGHKAVAMVKGLENQLAFFEMQRKGVKSGVSAGAFLQSLLADLDRQAPLDPDAPRVRVHMIGHSFGGLVVANAARSLANDGVFARCQGFELRSLCLVEGAMASGWFENEPRTVGAVTGALSCVFSRYDSANGFWYPAANQARLAAGYLGMSNVANADGPPVVLGRDGLFAMLVRPPKLVGAVALATGQRRRPPYLLNLDASRIVYEGSLALGGGHGDIFKDDVVNLIWAATSL